MLPSLKTKYARLPPCLALPWSAVRNIIMIAVGEEEEEEDNLTFYSAMLGMKHKNTTIPTFLTSKSTSLLANP